MCRVRFSSVLTVRKSGYADRARITVMVLGLSDLNFALWSVLSNLEDSMYLELAPAKAHEAISDGDVTLVDIRDPESFQAARLADEIGRASCRERV